MKKTIVLSLLKNRRVRGMAIKALKNPRVQRAIANQVKRRLGGK